MGRRCQPRVSRESRAAHCQNAGPKVYVARLEPYRLSDLDRLLDSIRKTAVQIRHRQDRRRPRSRWFESASRCAYRSLRSGTSASMGIRQQRVAQGLMQRLLKGDARREEFLARSTSSTCCRWRTRTVWRGHDALQCQREGPESQLGKPADVSLVHGERGLERWLESMIAAGHRPHLAIELHNDGRGLCTSAVRGAASWIASRADGHAR